MTMYMNSLETLHYEPPDDRLWPIVNRVASDPQLSLLGASKLEVITPSKSINIVRTFCFASTNQR